MSIPANLIRQLLPQGPANGYQIPMILSPEEMNFMAGVWTQIRVARNFTDISWQAHGYPQGPALSAPSYAAIQYVWPQIRVAANWSDISWSHHLVPGDVIGAASVIPEAAVNTAQPIVPASVTNPSTAPTSPVFPSVFTGGGYGSPISDYGDDDPGALNDPTKPAVQQAGFAAGLSLPIMLALGTVAFFLIGKPKGPRGKRRRR